MSVPGTKVISVCNSYDMSLSEGFFAFGLSDDRGRSTQYSIWKYFEIKRLKEQWNQY